MTRAEQLLALHEARNEWVKKVLATNPPFNPEGRKDGSDYNLHHVDLEADGEAEDEFAAIAARIFAGGE